MALRNIVVGDDLSGKTVYFQFPNDLAVSASTTFIQGSTSTTKTRIKTNALMDAVMVNNNASAATYVFRPDQSINLPSIDLVSNWGTVTAIDTTSEAYPYTFIDEGGGTTYTVTFKNYDGTVLKTQSVSEGGNATPPSTPTKPSTAQYSYTFNGWDNPYTNITADTVCTAQYTETIRSYTVYWMIDAAITSQSYNYGATPYHADPTKTGYTFTGWSPTITPVTGNITYTAQFMADECTVTFKDWDGTTLKTETVAYGGNATPPTNPSRPSTEQYIYTFTGWSGSYTNVTSNTTVTAQYSSTLREYTITWSVNGTNTSEQYSYGSTPSFSGSTDKPSTPQYNYTFTGWSPTITTVTGDKTYTAQYSETLRAYTITFVTNTTPPTISEQYNYGTFPTPPTISKTGYVLTGWAPEVEEVTGTATYTAEWTETGDLPSIISAYGKQIAFKCTINGTEYGADNIVSANPHYDGAMFHTVMKCLDIEIDNITGDFKGQTVTTPTLTVTSPLGSADKVYGTYIIKEQEESKDLSSLKLECYDKMLEAMTPYDLDLDYSAVTVKSLLTSICSRFGWTLGTTTFINENVVIPREMFDNSVTFRYVLDQIAQVTMSTITFNSSDKLCLLTPKTTAYSVSADELSVLTIGEQYGPVNALVLSRTPQEDNIYIRNSSSIDTNGLTEIKIENNQLIEAWRVEAEGSADTRITEVMNNMFIQVSELTYRLYDLTSFGLAYIDLMDRFTVQDADGNTYDTLMLNDDLQITQGLKETSSIIAPTETETEYKAASTTDIMLNKTILRVDKQENEIQEIITQTTNTTNDVTGLSEAVTKALERIDTAEASIITITNTVENGASSVTTETGFTFDKDGLKISKSGEEMASLVDNTGLYVNRADENILTANNEGVNAINLTARQYLTIGRNSRLEDYQSNRTACFYIGG